MDRQIIILTTDKRQQKLAELFEEAVQIPGEEEVLNCEAPCEKIYVLPTPVSKMSRNPEMVEKLKQELIKWSNFGTIELKVFGGAMDMEWRSFLEMYNISYWDFMDLPEVIEGNGWITAEATIAEVLLQSDTSIYGQKVLVTGYGCCGEKIAKLFGKLGAKVIVAARRESVRERIRKDGFLAVDFEDMKNEMVNVETVINTVPSLVLTEECIEQMPQGSLIIDIASKPGGTDFEAAKRFGVKSKLALGLPGIYTTTSSALLLKKALSKYAPLPENVRGDKLWIFQIII